MQSCNWIAQSQQHRLKTSITKEKVQSFYLVVENKYNTVQDIHSLLYIIISTFRLYLILHLYLVFFYLFTFVHFLFMFCSNGIFPVCILSLFSFCQFCNYLHSGTNNTSKHFSRKIAWYSDGIFRWDPHRLSHLYKQCFCLSVH